MKKILVAVLALALALSMLALAVAEGTVMSYADYAAAAVDSPVNAEAYVQAKLTWWDNKTSIYAADKDGA